MIETPNTFRSVSFILSVSHLLQIFSQSNHFTCFDLLTSHLSQVFSKSNHFTCFDLLTSLLSQVFSQLNHLTCFDVLTNSLTFITGHPFDTAGPLHQLYFWKPTVSYLIVTVLDFSFNVLILAEYACSLFLSTPA